MLKHAQFCLFVDVHKSRLSRRASSVGLSKAIYSMFWEGNQNLLSTYAFFFLTFLYIVSFGFTIASSPVLRFYSFHIRTTLRDLGFFSLWFLYIPVYYFHVAKIWLSATCWLKNKQGITVTKLFLKLKYIFMCLWLFIAESTFYAQYIKCYLSRFLVSYICVFEKNQNQQ